MTKHANYANTRPPRAFARFAAIRGARLLKKSGSAQAVMLDLFRHLRTSENFETLKRVQGDKEKFVKQFRYFF
jgi:hypothetical protein